MAEVIAITVAPIIVLFIASLVFEHVMNALAFLVNTVSDQIRRLL